MDHVELSSVRNVDRFMRLAAEKRLIFPSSLFLSGIQRIGANSAHGGGFGDVWKGEHEGKLVALKVLRLFCFTDQEKMQRVRIRFSGTYLFL